MLWIFVVPILVANSSTSPSRRISPSLLPCSVNSMVAVFLTPLCVRRNQSSHPLNLFVKSRSLLIAITLGKTGDPDAAAPLQQLLLSEEDPIVYEAECEALAALQSFAFLRDQLASPDTVRSPVHLAKALRADDSDETTELLLEVAQTSPHRSLRVEAFESVLANATETRFGALCGILLKEPDERARDSMVLYLGAYARYQPSDVILADAAGARAAVGPGPILSDDRPALELRGTLRRAGGGPAGELALVESIARSGAVADPAAAPLHLWIRSRMAREAGEVARADDLERLAERSGLALAGRARLDRLSAVGFADLAARSASQGMNGGSDSV